MKSLKILGPGCPKCQQLATQTKLAADALGLPCSIDKVSDIQEIMTFGVMATPALVVDGQIRVVGRVPSLDELKKILAA